MHKVYYSPRQPMKTEPDAVWYEKLVIEHGTPQALNYLLEWWTTHEQSTLYTRDFVILALIGFMIANRISTQDSFEVVEVTEHGNENPISFDEQSGDIDSRLDDWHCYLSPFAFQRWPDFIPLTYKPLTLGTREELDALFDQ